MVSQRTISSSQFQWSMDNEIIDISIRRECGAGVGLVSGVRCVLGFGVSSRDRLRACLLDRSKGITNRSGCDV